MAGDRRVKTAADDIKRAPTSVLYATASDIVTQETAQSLIFDPVQEAQIPSFNREEVKVGRVVGRGGFCVVLDVVKLMNEDGETISTTSEICMQPLAARLMRQRSFNRRDNKLAGNGAHSVHSGFSSNQSEGEDIGDTKSKAASVFGKIFRKRSRSRYVLKQLAPELKSSDKVTFLKGTVDLAMEAKYLSSCDHPNIIELCGISMNGPFEDGFFLLLEKVSETLSKRIKKWMDVDRHCKGITGVFAGSKTKIADLHRERFEASLGICTGAGYLHQKNIIFRDLKPDNIGFDLNGVLKIFDFGLAKELRKSQQTGDGLYHLTGFTGSPRYMAPEVGLGKPYNLSVDVYSWSMIMWFIMALEPPYGFYTEAMIAERVFERGSRPSIFKKWPNAVGNIMKLAWDADIFRRPTFSEIMVVLKNELTDSEPTYLESFGESD